MSTKKTHYEILGLHKTATEDEIKKAYRRVAKECHPDCPGNNPPRFVEATEAYDILSNPSKRKAYDDILENRQSPLGRTVFWKAYSGNFYNADPFSSESTPRFVAKISLDVKTSISVDMGQAYEGFRAVVKFDRQTECLECLGKGILSADKTKCPTCSAAGYVSLGTCRTCSGTGKIRTICQKCHGAGKFQSVGDSEISMPPKTLSGYSSVVKGVGNRTADGKTGNLTVSIRYMQQHEGVFCESDGTLKKTIMVPWEAVLMGEEYRFKVFSICKDEVSVVLDPNLPAGGTISLNGLGMAGKDLIVKVWYALPSKMSEVDRETIARVIRNAKSKTG